MYHSASFNQSFNQSLEESAVVSKNDLNISENENEPNEDYDCKFTMYRHLSQDKDSFELNPKFAEKR